MKRLIAILVLVVMTFAVVVITGCGCNNNEVTPPYENGYENGHENEHENEADNSQIYVDPGVSPILELMVEYAQTEQRVTSVMLREKFRNEPELFLEAMVVNEQQGRGNDATLMLLGSHIATFRRENSELYAEYVAALERLDNADLDEDSARMLRFIHANIEHAYNH
ncbi:MAG: hypothetical protein FWE04_04875 [Oscillospiraceae bacterium]|nr:hypothetical protein [Oscillospiraceae bacterium]